MLHPRIYSLPYSFAASVLFLKNVKPALPTIQNYICNFAIIFPIEEGFTTKEDTSWPAWMTKLPHSTIILLVYIKNLTGALLG